MTTSLPDWADRLKRGQSIIPEPIYPEEAERALNIFKQLRIPDIAGQPTFGEAGDKWIFDYVSAIFGGYNSETGQQHIKESLLLVSKKNGKSTLAAAIMLTALILCWRQEEEHLILAPTKEIADNSFKPASAMVRIDDELSAMFHVQDHLRIITHREKRNTLKVVAADTDTVAGKKAGRVLVDELWVFGSKAKADGMLMEATGGLASRPEGFVIYLTTQSDEPPAGVFKERLNYARDVRDGVIKNPAFLPVLYEFPKAMLKSKAYLKPENFYITNPNLGKSVSKQWIIDNLARNKNKQDGGLQKFIAKHLNIEIGVSLRNDRWAGADFWSNCAITLTLNDVIERSEVVVVGIDGGGLDDLLGFAVIGRDRETHQWLLWSHAWAHRIVLERRKEIAPRLLDFAEEGDLDIVDVPGQDVQQVVDVIRKLQKLLPKQNAIGVDPAGIGAIVSELEEQGVATSGQIIGISQGWKLNGAIKTTERKVASRELLHANQKMMDWVVGNARIRQVGNADMVTKQESGKAKIDPLMAAFNAVSLMELNPAPINKKIVMMVL